LQALRDYQSLIVEVDRMCDHIRQRYLEHIACKKGCAGNCCRIHISVFPVEAVSFAAALQKLPPKKVRHIRQKARQANSFGPCPLLEKGACRMYASRAVICRTHGLPVLTEYRGRSSIGFCLKNFQKMPSIPGDAVIELAPLNNALMAVNRQFVREYSSPFPFVNRLTIGQALLLDVA
jgi:Fe-S-cluster containining protein